MSRGRKKIVEEILKVVDDTDGLILSEELLDYGEENLPMVVEVFASDMAKLDLYEYIEKGRVFKNGLQIVCVELVRKHK